MIEVKGLTKKYGDHYAIDHLNFTVERGHIYGFLGPNGAGKSTTMNIITGCLAATEGTVTIDGHDIYDEPIEAKRGVGYLPEIPPLYADMTPYEYLDFVARAKGVDKGLIDEKIDLVMSETGITDMQDRLIKNLSKGYRQRVGIAQARLGDPQVIILDEPTVGLDPKQIIEIRDLITRLGKDHTVILSSHILSEISAVCDYVIIIAHGKVVAQDSLENLALHYTSSATVRVKVKGGEGSVRMAVDTVKESIIGYNLGADKDEPEYLALEISIPRDTDIREALSKALVENGCTILAMSTETLSLEDVFLELTKDVDEDASASEQATAGKIDDGGDSSDTLARDIAMAESETAQDVENIEDMVFDAADIEPAGETETGEAGTGQDNDGSDGDDDGGVDEDKLEAAEAAEKARALAEADAKMKKAETKKPKKKDDGEYHSLFSIGGDDK